MTPLEIPAIRNTVKTDLFSYVDMNTVMTNIDSCFGRAATQEYLTEDKRDSGDFAGLVWMYACLLDAAVNDRNYPAEKNECGTEWEAAVRWLKNELKKKKFITGKFVYDVPALCGTAVKALGCLDSKLCGGDLIKAVQESGGSLTDFFESVHMLTDRLSKAAGISEN